MNKRSKDDLRSLVPYRKLAEVLHPGIAPLDYPPPLVPPQLSSILMRGNRVVAAGWYDRLYPSPHKQRSHGVTVIASVTYQPLRLTSLALTRLDSYVGKRGFQQLHLRRGSLLQVYSERSTRAIGQYHKLCSLAAFSLPDQRTPFFARMNMPSMKHSSQRTFCRSESWFKNVRQRFRRTALSAHSLRRRWTALFEPYLAGSSLQGAPVHRIQRMPSKHWRSSSGGRPPLRERRRLGKCCFMSSHCSSVTARQAIGYLLDLVSYRASITCQPV